MFKFFEGEIYLNLLSISYVYNEDFFEKCLFLQSHLPS